MSHFLPAEETQKYSKTISSTRRDQVANLQQHIQQILSEDYHTFLQGSYANFTAISEINDVDIVAVRKSVFCSTHSPVVPHLTSPVEHPWDRIYDDVIQKLNNQKLYTWEIIPKEKCITVVTSSFKADIVPVVQIYQDVSLDPVAIRTQNGNQLTYPRDHKQNGILKNTLTEENYKPLVRIFKNWAKVRLPKDTVSSHQIESLIHFADTNLFSNDHLGSFILVSDFIINKLSGRDILPICIPSVCGNEDITENWDTLKRQEFVRELIRAKELAINSYNATSSTDAARNWNEIFKV